MQVDTCEAKETIREFLERDGGCPLTEKQMESAVDALWEYLSDKVYAGYPLDAMCKGLAVYRNVLEYVLCLAERTWPRTITMHDIAATYRVVRFKDGFVLLQPNDGFRIYPGIYDDTRPWYADPRDAADEGMLMASTLIDRLKAVVEKHGDMPVAVPCITEEGFVMTSDAGWTASMYDPEEYKSAEEFIDDAGSELAMFNGKPYIGPCFTIGEL